MKNARASRGREHGLGLKMWLCLSLAVSSGCSTAATVPADSPDEAYIRDLLFSNNRTGRTYFASYFLPYVRIEDECLDLNGLDEPRTVELLAKHQVTAANADLDRPYIAGTEMRRIITGITIDVPRYSRLFNMPKSRRKGGDGNITCGTGNPKFAHLRRPLTFRLADLQHAVRRDRAVNAAEDQRAAARVSTVERRPEPGDRVGEGDVAIEDQRIGEVDWHSRAAARLVEGHFLESEHLAGGVGAVETVLRRMRAIEHDAGARADRLRGGQREADRANRVRVFAIVQPAFASRPRVRERGMHDSAAGAVIGEICASCTFSPAPEKDLCPVHRQEFEAWKAAKRA